MRRMAFARRLVSAVDFSSARKDAFGGEWPRQAVAVCGTRRTRPVTGTNAPGDGLLTAVGAKIGNQARKTPDQSCCPRGPEPRPDAREPLVRHPTRQSQPCPPATSSPNGSGPERGRLAKRARRPIPSPQVVSRRRSIRATATTSGSKPMRQAACPPSRQIRGFLPRECRIIPANG